MSTMGTTRIFPLTMTSGGVSSTVAFIGGTYQKYALAVPTMTSGTDIRLAVSDSATGTVRTLYHSPTVTSAAVVFNIVSAVSQAMVPVNLVGEYVKILHTTTCSDTSHQYAIYCST